MLRNYLLIISNINLLFALNSLHCWEIKIENEESLYPEFINKFNITDRAEKEKLSKKYFGENLLKIKMIKCFPEHECKIGKN